MGRGFGAFGEDPTVDDEEKGKRLKELTEAMGFTYEKAKVALHRSQWNVGKAVELLASGVDLSTDNLPGTDDGLKEDLKLAEYARGKDGKVGALDASGAGFGRGFGGFCVDLRKDADAGMTFLIDEEVEDLLFRRTEHGLEVKLTKKQKEDIDRIIEITQTTDFKAVEAYKTADNNLEGAINLLMGAM